MKITPYEVEGQMDYNKIVKKFGLSLINKGLLGKMDKVPRMIENGYFFAHRDFDRIMQDYKKGQDFAIVSGRGPSQNIHLGHLIVYKLVKEMQDIFGCYVFMPFSDDEKFFAKDIGYKKAQEYSLENARDILALGFDPKKTEIFIDSMHMNPTLYNIAVRAAKKLTMSTVKAIYGFKNEHNIGLHFYPAMQTAHILYPTVKKGLPVLVPIGIDQDPHIRAARDVAFKMRLKKPASIESRFLPSLSGGGKMSASGMDTIYLNNGPKTVKNKVQNAFTGGRDTLGEQKQEGGEPEKCPLDKYMSVFFEQEGKTRKRRGKCRKGEIMCGECKNILMKDMNRFLKEHRKARQKVKIEDFVRD